MTKFTRLLKIPTVLLGTALLATSCAGAVGSSGAVGPQGPAGPQGPQGLTGAIGSTGNQGPVGPAGPQGLAGEQGPRGFSGSDGAQGPTGLNGISSFEAYVNLYPGYVGTEASWISELDAGTLDKTLTVTINNAAARTILTNSGVTLTGNDLPVIKVFKGQVLSLNVLNNLVNLPSGLTIEGWYSETNHLEPLTLPLTVLDSNLVFFPKVYNGVSFVSISAAQTLTTSTNTITALVNYPDAGVVDASGLGAYLVDAKITSSAAIPAGTQISLTYREATGGFISGTAVEVLPATAFTMTAGQTIYLSSLPLPVKQTALNLHKNLIAEFVITITGVAPINSIITITPVIYSTTAKLNEIELTK